MVHTHLKAIVRKTGAARQADLVKLMAGVAGPFVPATVPSRTDVIAKGKA